MVMLGDRSETEKEHILYYSIYIKLLKEISIVAERRSSVLGGVRRHGKA